MEPPRKLDLEQPKDRKLFTHYRDRFHMVPVVTIAGQIQHKVLAYDCDERWVRRYSVDAQGRVICAGDEFQTELVQGDVDVCWANTEEPVRLFG